MVEHDAQNDDDEASAKAHQASVEIADALAKMFSELKPKVMAKYSLEDEQIILLAIVKAAVSSARIRCRLAHSRPIKQRNWSASSKV